MSNVLIDKNTIDILATSLIEKTGLSSSTITLSQMISTVNNPDLMMPSGTIELSQNKIYDIKSFASASVSVPLNRTIENSIVQGNVVAYENNQIFKVRKYAFCMCWDLNAVSLPNCLIIESNAFSNCTALTSISFPACTSVGSSAFNFCISLTEVAFPVCTSIGEYAFYYCSSLTTISFPSCTSIGWGAFTYCTALTSISFPACSYIDTYAFYQCYSLTTISFPNCSFIGQYAFQSCNKLAEASFPVCTTIGISAFANCWSLSTASFPSCTTIQGSAFASCYNLLSLYLLGSSVCSIGGAGIFYNTPISNYTISTGGVHGSIYVPASLLTTYKNATNWAVYSSRFVGV